MENSKSKPSCLPRPGSRASVSSGGFYDKTNGKIKGSPSSTEILNPNSDDLKINDTVYVNGQKLGIIKFLGETSFAPGLWSGIELDENKGKNDGSINGVRYFECKPNHGIFVRPYRLTINPVSDYQINNNNVLSRNNSVIDSDVTCNNVAHLKIGDRVLVLASRGLKKGTLRFIGTTDFAPGKWGGIELNEPSGKNDGSVAGKRYFECKPDYGLFALVSKIRKDSSNNIGITPSNLPPKKIPTLAKKYLSGSEESLASVASSTSNISSKIRSISDKNGSFKSQTSSLTSALQKTLKEKEECISKLLKERDSDLNELADANTKANYLNEELALLRNEHAKYSQERENEIEDLKQAIEEGIRVQKSLVGQLEESKKKIEMLEFRLEEELAAKMEMKEEIEKLVDCAKSVHKEEDNEMELFQLQEEIIKKDEKIITLETSLESKKSETANLLKRIKELNSKVTHFDERRDKQLETIDELNLKLKKSDDICEKLRKDLSKKNEELSKVRDDLDDLLKKTGDDNSQINVITDKLKRTEEAKKRLKSELERMVSKYENEEKEKIGINKEISGLKRQIKEKEVIENGLNEKIRQLSNDLEAKVLAIDKFERQLNDLCQKSGDSNEHLQTVNNQLIAKLEEMEKIEEFSRKLNDSLDKLEVDNRILKTENEQVNLTLEERDEEIESLKCKLKESTNEIKIGNEKISSLEEQIRDLLKRTSDRDNHLISLNEDLARKQKEIDSLREGFDGVKNELFEVASEKRRLCSEIQEMKRNDMQKSAESESCNKKRTELEKTIDELNDQMKNLKGKNRALEEEKLKLLREVHLFKLGSEEKEETLKKSKEKLEITRKEFDEYRKGLEKELEKSRLENKDLLEKLRENEKSVQIENRKLLESIDKYKNELSYKSKELEEYKERHQETLNEFKVKSEQLEKKLKEADKKLAEKEKALCDIKAENINNVDLWKRRMEEEKSNLVNKIECLENAISANTIPKSISNGPKALDTSSSEREQYESQVNFLNSVIVAMHKDIDELKARVRVYEEIGFADFDYSQVGNLPQPPRKFCDICGVFDAHETEECPAQVTHENQTHSYFNGKRNQERPFCHNCEVFGHWTDQCSYNECF